jgi:hypothetical protein
VSNMNFKQLSYVEIVDMSEWLRQRKTLVIIFFKFQ